MFEYRKTTVSTETWQDHSSQMDEEGWEMVSAQERASGDTVFYWKRLDYKNDEYLNLNDLKELEPASAGRT